MNTYHSDQGCGNNVRNLVDGLPDERPGRYEEGSPISHLPLGVTQILINGEDDGIVSIDHIDPYYKKAIEKGDPIDLVTIPIRLGNL